MKFQSTRAELTTTIGMLKISQHTLRKYSRKEKKKLYVAQFEIPFRRGSLFINF